MDTTVARIDPKALDERCAASAQRPGRAPPPVAGRVARHPGWHRRGRPGPCPLTGLLLKPALTRQVKAMLVGTAAVTAVLYLMVALTPDQRRYRWARRILSPHAVGGELADVAAAGTAEPAGVLTRRSRAGALESTQHRMIMRWPHHIPDRHTSKITNYGTIVAVEVHDRLIITTLGGRTFADVARTISATQPLEGLRHYDHYKQNTPETSTINRSRTVQHQLTHDALRRLCCCPYRSKRGRGGASVDAGGGARVGRMGCWHR